MVRQGYLPRRGQYLIYPAVQPDAAGNAAAVFYAESRLERVPERCLRQATRGQQLRAGFVAARGTGPSGLGFDPLG